MDINNTIKLKRLVGAFLYNAPDVSLNRDEIKSVSERLIKIIDEAERTPSDLRRDVLSDDHDEGNTNTPEDEESRTTTKYGVLRPYLCEVLGATNQIISHAELVRYYVVNNPELILEDLRLRKIRLRVRNMTIELGRIELALNDMEGLNE